MERQLKTGDFRERVFQDNIIRPFLQSVFSELDIEPVDVKTATTIHQYEQYCGFEIICDKKAKKTKKFLGTPDLCIADEWYWDNDVNTVNYRGVVEIKSPTGDDKTTGISPNEYTPHTLREIKQYLTAERNSKIILTDGLTWTFYEKEKSIIDEKGNISPESAPICLGNITVTYKRKTGYKRKLEKDKNGNKIIEIEFELFENKFMELKEKLKTFILKNK